MSQASPHDQDRIRDLLPKRQTASFRGQERWPRLCVASMSKCPPGALDVSLVLPFLCFPSLLVAHSHEGVDTQGQPGDQHPAWRGCSAKTSRRLEEVMGWQQGRDWGQTGMPMPVQHPGHAAGGGAAVWDPRKPGTGSTGQKVLEQ